MHINFIKVTMRGFGCDLVQGHWMAHQLSNTVSMPNYWWSNVVIHAVSSNKRITVFNMKFLFLLPGTRGGLAHSRTTCWIHHWSSFHGMAKLYIPVATVHAVQIQNYVQYLDIKKTYPSTSINSCSHFWSCLAWPLSWLLIAAFLYSSHCTGRSISLRTWILQIALNLYCLTCCYAW